MQDISHKNSDYHCRGKITAKCGYWAQTPAWQQSTDAKQGYPFTRGMFSPGPQTLSSQRLTGCPLEAF